MACLLVIPGVAEAQSQRVVNDDVDSKGFHAERNYFSPEPWEHFDPASGNLILTFTDLALPGNAGRSLSFTRTYNNQHPESSPLCISQPDCATGLPDSRWTFGFPGMVMRVIEQPVRADYTDYPYPTTDLYEQVIRTTPIYVMADGSTRRTVYTTDPLTTAMETANVISPEFYIYDRATRTLRMPDGTTAAYEPDTGRLVSFSDGFGNMVTLEWSATSVAVRQDLGAGQVRTITLGLDDRARVRTLTYLDRQWTYEYGYQPAAEATSRDITQVTSPEGTLWRFEYESPQAGAPTGVLVEQYGLSRVTTPHGGTIEYEYAEGGTAENGNYQRGLRFRRSRDRGTAEAAEWQVLVERNWPGRYSPLSTIVTPSGTRVEYEHGLVSDSRPALMSGAVGLIRQSVFDGTHLVEQTERTYKTVRIVSYATDRWFGTPELERRQIRRLDPDTGTSGPLLVTTYTYDVTGPYGGFHKPLAIVENNNLGVVRTTTRSYRHLWAPFVVGLPESETVSINGGPQLIRSWEYDEATGFLTRETQAGLATTYTPDGFGNTATMTTPTQKTTSFTYSWGRVKDTTTPEYTVQRSINPDGTTEWERQGTRTTAYGYDKLMRVRIVTPPGNSNAIETDYDNAGGAWVRTRRGASVTTTTLDGLGRAAATSTADARTVTRYDAEGRTLFTGYPVSPSSPDIGVQFQYDALGRVRRQQNPDGSSSTRRYAFTANGLPSVTIQDEEARTTAQTWLPFGHPDDARLVTLTDAAGADWSYAYDVAGQLRSVTAADGVGRTWRYNAAFLLESETHPESGTTTYTYNGGLLATRTDQKGQVTTYTYDDNDRLQTVTAGASITRFEYEPGSDNVQRTTSDGVVSEFAYDTAGRLESRTDTVDGKPFRVLFGYDSSDNLAQITYPSGRKVAYQHNAESRIVRVYNAETQADYATEFDYHASGALAQYRAGNGLLTTITYDPQRYWIERITVGAAGEMNIGYGNYDRVGNVRTITEPHAGSQTFTYDPLDRLDSATGSYGIVDYAYDIHGNQQGANFGYDTPNPFRLTRFSTMPMTYDLNGNVTTRSTDEFTYTAENLLQAATVGSQTTRYAYDADAWRVKKAVEDGATTYYVRGPNGQLLMEWTNTSPLATVREYVYAGPRLVAIMKGDVPPK